jgi:hypothetical protein
MIRRLKDPMLEKYLAEEVSGPLRQSLEETLSESPADACRLEELRADTQAFLADHPPGVIAEWVELEMERGE